MNQSLFLIRHKIFQNFHQFFLENVRQYLNLQRNIGKNAFSDDFEKNFLKKKAKFLFLKKKKIFCHNFFFRKIFYGREE